ncbi:hypothetical protein ACHAXS_007840 [Conticribra weissflogii]
MARIGIIAFFAVIAISLGPLARHLLWRNAAPLDEDVGAIDILSTDQLTSRVKGKHALLIGGTRGVGFGTAVALAKAGAHVTIVGRSEKSGLAAVSEIEEQSSGSGSGAAVKFIQGDIGTVCSAMDLVKRLENEGKQYDLAVVSAATFPDFSKPLLNDDGIDKSFAIGVVGRYLIHRNMHLFMNDGARILNVMASGINLPEKVLTSWDPDVASGKRNVSGLFEGVMTFGLGNQIMLDTLFQKDEHFSNNEFTMVTTHPGVLKTDLHRGQGLLFDILEGVAVALIGISVKDAGIRQSSILASEKLRPKSLTRVDQFAYGRLNCRNAIALNEKHSDWLWQFLGDLESKASTCNV